MLKHRIYKKDQTFAKALIVALPRFYNSSYYRERQADPNPDQCEEQEEAKEQSQGQVHAQAQADNPAQVPAQAEGRSPRQEEGKVENRLFKAITGFFKTNRPKNRNQTKT